MRHGSPERNGIPSQPDAPTSAPVPHGALTMGGVEPPRGTEAMEPNALRPFAVGATPAVGTVLNTAMLERPDTKAAFVSAIRALPDWAELEDAGYEPWFRLPDDFPKDRLPDHAKEGLVLGHVDDQGESVFLPVETATVEDWGEIRLTVTGDILDEDAHWQFLEDVEDEDEVE